MPIPPDSSERIKRLRSLAYHADRAAKGLSGAPLAVMLPAADPKELTMLEATQLLATNGWDVELALTDYKSRNGRAHRPR